MKQPLYAILIAPVKKTREDIISGRKTITIREGHRDYKPGTAMLCCHVDPWAVMVDVTSVSHCLLTDVSEKDYQADGFNSKEELLAGLQAYYSGLDWESPVTIIKWENARGKLVKT